MISCYLQTGLSEVWLNRIFPRTNTFAPLRKIIITLMHFNTSQPKTDSALKSVYTHPLPHPSALP